MIEFYKDKLGVTINIEIPEELPSALSILHSQIIDSVKDEGLQSDLLDILEDSIKGIQRLLNKS